MPEKFINTLLSFTNVCYCITAICNGDGILLPCCKKSNSVFDGEKSVSRQTAPMAMDVNLS
jgi:hypothetical protein